MTEKVTPNLSAEFFERMDRTARFYQQAVMLLAEEQVAEIQAALDAQVSQPKALFWQKVRTISQNLIRRLTPCSLEKSGRKGGKTSGRIQPAVIERSRLPRPLDQSPWIEDAIELFPQISHPNNE